MSVHDLTFDHATYDLWHDDLEMSRYNIGDERWFKYFVRNIDYLFNNAIWIKNDEVVMCFLRDQLMALNSDPGLMKDLCPQVLNLKNECYCPERIKSKTEMTKLLNASDYFKRKTLEAKESCFDLLVDGVKVRTQVNKFPHGRPKMNQLMKFN